MQITPLELWIKTRIGLDSRSPLSPAALTRFQMDRFNRTLAYVRQNSPFYRRLLAGFPRESLSGPDDISTLPFTTADDLRQRHLDMLCVSQGEISRVVTLRTSGTTGSPKRLFFTDDDLELTIDFFHHGMSTLVCPGQRVIILMPGKTRGSVGDQLARGLKRMDVKSIVHGPVQDPGRVIDEILEHRIDALVAIPLQALALSRHPRGALLKDRVKNVLLSTDYVPRAIVDDLENRWGCRVYEHYGMTEMGLGGGVQCRARSGYHLREADLFFEVVDPGTGRPLPIGETGEVVFTTLTRQGMPLIRYRTGDLSRFIPEQCPCGSVLRRLDKITGRVEGTVVLNQSAQLDMPGLDEAILGLPGILNYSSEIDRSLGRDQLVVTIHGGPNAPESLPEQVQNAIAGLPAIQAALDGNTLEVKVRYADSEPVSSSGTAKRQIWDKRMWADKIYSSNHQANEIQAPYISAIILAAGYSSRMGAFKPLLLLDGQTMIDRVVSLFREVGIGDISVVVGHRREEMRAHLVGTGVRVIDNLDFDTGMFSSVQAGVKGLKPPSRAFFILPVDIPLVRRQTIEALGRKMAETEAPIVYPCFQGKRGHPPLIRSEIREEIERAEPGVTLRDILHRYRSLAVNIEVPDRHILFDVDTPDKYRELQKRWKHYDIPSDGECEVLYERFGPLPEDIRRHCRMVARVADRIGRALNDRGEDLDLELIRAASLLHDIAKGHKNHARVGAEWIRKIGFAWVADIASQHGDLKVAPEAGIGEEEIVFLADKLVRKDRIGTLEHRYQSSLRQYQENAEAVACIRDRWSRAEIIRKRVEERLGEALDGLLETLDGNP